MKVNLFLMVLICSVFNLFGQSPLFTEVSIQEAKLYPKQTAFYESLAKNPYVVDLAIIDIEANQLQEATTLNIAHKSKAINVKLLNKEERELNNFAWFGTLDDGTGIFFTVFGNEVFSKFYIGNTPYTIMPLSKGYHVLIGFDSEIAMTKCLHGTKGLEKTQKIVPPREPVMNNQSQLVDDNCNLRVLIVFTDDADNVLNMRLISQGLIDETNLAYMQSQINFRMELARVVQVNYDQVDTETSQTIYGATASIADDLVRLRNSTDGFAGIPALRDAYQADIVALIRQSEGNGAGAWSGLSGVAFGIPTGTLNPAPENAFVACSNNGFSMLIAGRFTFAHEIGHIQGARHDTHDATPDFARGFIIGTGNNPIRTIVAAQGATCTNDSTACRIQFFSNPNVQFNGQAVGDATHNNALRINNTSVVMRNHRMTSENLTVQNETFGNEVIANHLANQTIVTTGNVIAQNGSLLTMRAGTSITLNAGFQTQTGATFSARVVPNPCTILPQNIALKNEGTNISKAFSNKDIAVFPNPSSDKISVTFNNDDYKKGSIAIFDTYGRQRVIILSLSDIPKGGTTFEVDISQLEKGIYIVKTQLDDNVYTKLFVIIK